MQLEVIVEDDHTFKFSKEQLVDLSSLGFKWLGVASLLKVSRMTINFTDTILILILPYRPELRWPLKKHHPETFSTSTI